eukprot:Cvel_20736.t1-p1 / transcript=Cvel_20736.t1 / gene=Cvel_20736 / organism=Chromera_velia_CCMP2878 / gene_product=hypothetical protein / transcript_product=hypothetical protein / location=Cvel_scaffold1888:35027-37350(+) / protein_length=774 / sequence_SO=supercontig / SO=protein_coding / is_pseudo=false
MRRDRVSTLERGEAGDAERKDDYHEGFIVASDSFIPSVAVSQGVNDSRASPFAPRPDLAQAAGPKKGPSRAIWRFYLIAILLGFCQQLPIATLTASAAFFTSTLAVENLFLFMVIVLFVPAPFILLMQIAFDRKLDLKFGVAKNTLIRIPGFASVMGGLLLLLAFLQSFPVLLVVTFLVGCFSAALLSSSMQIVAPEAYLLPALVQCGTGVAAIFVVLISQLIMLMAGRFSEENIIILFAIPCACCWSVAAFFLSCHFAGWFNSVYEIIEAYRRYRTMIRSGTLPLSVADFTDFLCLRVYDFGNRRLQVQPSCVATLPLPLPPQRRQSDENVGNAGGMTSRDIRRMLSAPAAIGREDDDSSCGSSYSGWMGGATGRRGSMSARTQAVLGPVKPLSQSIHFAIDRAQARADFFSGGQDSPFGAGLDYSQQQQQQQQPVMQGAEGGGTFGHVGGNTTTRSLSEFSSVVVEAGGKEEDGWETCVVKQKPRVGFQEKTEREREEPPLPIVAVQPPPSPAPSSSSRGVPSCVVAPSTQRVIRFMNGTLDPALARSARSENAGSHCQTPLTRSHLGTHFVNGDLDPNLASSAPATEFQDSERWGDLDREGVTGIPPPKAMAKARHRWSWWGPMFGRKGAKGQGVDGISGRQQQKGPGGIVQSSKTRMTPKSFSKGVTFADSVTLKEEGDKKGPKYRKGDSWWDAESGAAASSVGDQSVEVLRGEGFDTMKGPVSSGGEVERRMTFFPRGVEKKGRVELSNFATCAFIGRGTAIFVMPFLL